MSAIPVTGCRMLQLRTCPGCGERLTQACWLPLAITLKVDGAITIEAVTYPVCLKCDARVFDEETMFSAASAHRDILPGPERPTFQGGCDAVVREWCKMDAALSAFRGEPHADVL